jgi:hypothetical protein
MKTFQQYQEEISEAPKMKNSVLEIASKIEKDMKSFQKNNKKNTTVGILSDQKAVKRINKVFGELLRELEKAAFGVK